ncbi:hypothetical protein Pdw03_0215 [Penicillium digitatum]|uniref:Uncharacterized protein n=1 Tax=Penicillium digitatum TaxID=36651 RepID=A0A7T6XQN7_PENDI|nr:hypothetical protein Pdw03_0215 [Penicillium digitatum]
MKSLSTLALDLSVLASEDGASSPSRSNAAALSAPRVAVASTTANVFHSPSLFFLTPPKDPTSAPRGPLLRFGLYQSKFPIWEALSCNKTTTSLVAMVSSSAL